MLIEKLNWDSEFFRIKIGRLDIINENDFNQDLFIEQAIDDKFDLIYVFKYFSEFKFTAIKEADLELTDIQLTMSKKLKKENYLNYPYRFRTELSENELNESYSIARETSKVSRFYYEKSIEAEGAARLYKIWIDNTLNKTFSDGLFLEKQLNSVLGIHLVKTDISNKTGYFTLTGVKSENRGRGIGSKLWIQSFAYWANESQIEIIRSKFSLKNLESFNFHLKMGFNKTEEIKYIYHWRNNFK